MSETDIRDKRVGLHAEHLRAIAVRSDRGAFAALFAHFAPRVKSYLLRFGIAPDTAEDLAQETMLLMWRKAALFDPRKSEAATWIFTIARNVRVDAWRKERFPTVDPDVLMTIEDDAPPADATVAASQREDRVRAALETLPNEQAEVVRLSFFDDLAHGDIAKKLGIPLGTVKSRIRLAMTRIRTFLGDDGQ